MNSFDERAIELYQSPFFPVIRGKFSTGKPGIKFISAKEANEAEPNNWSFIINTKDSARDYKGQNCKGICEYVRAKVT